MEKEINELTQQRDLAQSRLQNSLQSVGDHYDSRHWVNFFFSSFPEIDII